MLYHLAVLLRSRGLTLADAEEVLNGASPLSADGCHGRAPVARRGPRARARPQRVPLRHTFIDDCETPVSAFLKLRGDRARRSCSSRPSRASASGAGRSSASARARSLRWSLGDGGDPYALAARRGRALSARRRCAATLPPFAGGAVGFFGYDLVRTVEPLGEPNPDVLGLPDMALMLSDALVVFDHLKHTVTIIVNVSPTTSDVDAAYADARRDDREARAPAGRAGAARRGRRRRARAAGPSRSNMPREQFEAMVARIVEYIFAGDAFQVVPSQRWSAPRAGRRVLDLPRPARGQPVAVHVLPRLRGLPDRRRHRPSRC